MLLVDYLEDASEYIRSRKEKMYVLEEQYKHTFDRSAKQEVAFLKQEIKKKLSEVTNEILINLEELHYLRVYFPELLKVLMEDENIGKPLVKKTWLLDFKPLPAEEAAIRLQQLKMWRDQLKEAKKFLRGWVGIVDASKYINDYPLLRGYLKGKVKKEEVLEAIKKVDRMLLKEGWLLLINDSLIQIPLAKFSDKISKLRYEEMKANTDYQKARGRSSVAEFNALRKLQEITRKREHYETIIKQILLANPNYLRTLKKRKDWLSRTRKTLLQKLTETVTPRKVKERAWLNDMRKRLEE